MSATDDILRRIRGEYTEMPGMRVTATQAQRLWGLDPDTCSRALAALVDAGFLRRTLAGEYARASEGPSLNPPLRMATATIDRQDTSPTRSRRRAN